LQFRRVSQFFGCFQCTSMGLIEYGVAQELWQEYHVQRLPRGSLDHIT
jgi:hypothetical protein